MGKKQLVPFEGDPDVLVEPWRLQTKISWEQAKKLPLAHGAHDDRSNGLCVMELAAWVAGQMHSDSPPCVDSEIRDAMINANDNLSDGLRTRLLRPLLPLVLGTRIDHGLGTSWKRTEIKLRRWLRVFSWWVAHAAAEFELTDLPELDSYGDADAVAKQLRPLLPITEKTSVIDVYVALRRAGVAATAWSQAIVERLLKVQATFVTKSADVGLMVALDGYGDDIGASSDFITKSWIQMMKDICAIR